MKRKILPLILAAAFMMSGCASMETPGEKQYQATFLNLFDTVTTVVGYAASESEFKEEAQDIYDKLLEYHKLLDIYEEYEGMNNLKTVNDNAGIKPVEVDERIISFLQECKTLYEETNGRVNVAMGSVLKLWHEARDVAVEDPESAYLPDNDDLQEAANHISFDSILIDEDGSTVYISDPLQQLDVGAVAKGWAAEQVSREIPEGLLLSVGGNVCATGPRPTDGSPWIVGIQEPDEDENTYIHTIYVTDGAVVSSGDYQRYFIYEGKRYHHIIDPDTLYPSAYWRSVTILCPDSGLADALSTALFTLPLEEGRELLEKFDAEAMWLDENGNIYYTSGFESKIRT